MTFKCRIERQAAATKNYLLVLENDEEFFNQFISLSKDQLVTIMQTISKELATAPVYDETQGKWINIEPYSEEQQYKLTDDEKKIIGDKIKVSEELLTNTPIHDIQQGIDYKTRFRTVDIDNALLKIDGRVTELERDINLLKLSISDNISKMMRRLDQIESSLPQYEED